LNRLGSDGSLLWQRKNQESLWFTNKHTNSGAEAERFRNTEQVCIIFYDMFLRFAYKWDEEDEDVIEEEREVIEVAATGNGLILR
jgi:hypothetical protein